MASEIRVDKINSLSGVGTVTLSPTGVDIAGITTAATLRATTGIVTSLTAGSLTSLGAVSGTTGTFSGAVSGTTGTFSGAVSGTTGTFTGTVDIADTIVHTGDTNTKIRFPSADTITAETGGSERLRINSSGQLGLGASNNSDYDASAQNVLIASSGTTGITLRSGGSSYYGAIHFADGTSSSAEYRAGRILYEHSTDSLLFYNANTFRLKIDGSGNMGLGASSPTAASGETALHIYANEYPEVHLTSSVTGSNAGDGSIFTLNNDSSTIIRNQENSYIRFDTNGSNERMRILAAGGVTFNGDTSADNALDDYEEGTYTPTLTFASDDGNKAYANRGGSYTKIGRKVTVNLNINLSNRGTGSGLATVSLPFTVGDRLANTAFEGGGFAYYFINLLSSVSTIHLQARENTTTAELRGVLGSVSGNFSDFGYAYVSNSTELRMTVTYFT